MASRRNPEKADIQYVNRLLDDFYQEAVRDGGHPNLPLEPERVPAQMVQHIETNGMVVWQMLPSTITDEEIRKLESTLHHRLPPMYRAYLKSRFHLFEIFHDGAALGPLPCDDPFRGFRVARGDASDSMDISAQFQHRLFELGYILIGWDIYAHFALSTHDRDTEGDCEVVTISHSIENQFYGEEPLSPRQVTLHEVAQFTEPVCSSFREFVGRFIGRP